jgi:hypothetical protein
LSALAWARRAPAAARLGAGTRHAPLLAAAALIALSVLLRAPVFEYSGPLAPHPMNLYLSAHAGAYSDIAHLYFRDQLGRHPVPYFDYRFEYPVLTGAFVWVAGLVHTSVGAYFLTSAVLLLALGVLTVSIVRRIEGANVWIFAAAPALAFYAVLNWDLLGVCLLAASLLLFQRRRDTSASAMLALATWAKLFPIVLLPLVLALRVADRRWRAALGIAGTFGAVTLVVNAPFAVDPSRHGWLRPSWLYFFRFTETRPPRGTIWKPVLGHHADLVADPLMVAGLLVIVILAVRQRGRPGGSFIPASAAALLWVFATAKVYSPQYAIWIFAVLAIAGAPVWLAVAFAAIDALLFTTTFGPLYPGLPIHAVQWGAYGVRQVATAGLAVWVIRQDLINGGLGPQRRLFSDRHALPRLSHRHRQGAALHGGRR